MRNMSPIPTITMKNVLSKREQNFISDYSQFLMGAYAGQSPTAVTNIYSNIPKNRQNYLKNIVKNRYK